MTSERPDGGWGWVVAIAAMTSNIIIDGVKYSFGILFIDLQDAFRRSKSETSLIISIQLAALYLTGPIVGTLVNKFGCRKTACVGCLLSFIGFICSYFATSIFHLYITFGLVAGLGFGMSHLPVCVTLVRYFDKRLAIANGIFATGAGIVKIVFNPLIKCLNDMYTWRGTLLIEAGFVLNGLVIALLLRQPVVKNPKPNSDIENTLVSKHNDLNDSSTENKQQYTEVHYETQDTFARNYNELNEEYAGDIYQQFRLLNGYEDKINIDNDNGSISPNVQTESLEWVDKYIDSEEFKLEMKNTNTNSDRLSNSERTDRLSNSERIKSKAKLISLTPLKDPGFIILLVSHMLVKLAINIPITYLPDMMLKLGYTSEQAVWIMFMIGVMSTVSRIVIGFVADLPCINRLWLCKSLVILSGVLLVMCPFCFNYTSFIIFGVVFGASEGSSTILRGIWLPDLFGVDLIAGMVGINPFFSEKEAFLGLPIVEALFDVFGCYTLPFVVAGPYMIISGTLGFIIPRITSKAKYLLKVLF